MTTKKKYVLNKHKVLDAAEKAGFPTLKALAEALDITYQGLNARFVSGWGKMQAEYLATKIGASLSSLED